MSGSRRCADPGGKLLVCSKEVQGDHTDIGIGRDWRDFDFELVLMLAKLE
jgi:hypothetical protein